MKKKSNKAKQIAELVDKCLGADNAFEAVDSIISSKYFPKAWNESEFDKLPTILKAMNRIQGFIIHSGVNGLSGLLADYPMNIKIDQIEESLAEISATRSLRFIRHMKSLLPGEKYPKTVEEASIAEQLMDNVDLHPSPQNERLKACKESYPIETANLPEELRQFLRENRDQLVQALLAASSS